MRRATRYASILAVVTAFTLFPVVTVAQTLVIDGGTVHPMTGEPFVGSVVIEDGIITALGPNVSVPSGASRIDAAGMHVYPGMCDALSTLGLTEIGAIASTNDQAEMGMYNPHLMAATAIHPSSEVIPVTRANGVTHAVVAPDADRGGVIAGQAALVNLDGWTVEEMAIEPSVAMVINWPGIVTRRFDFTTFEFKDTPFNDAKEEAEKKQNELRDWIEAAKQYRQSTQGEDSRAEVDQKLAALSECLDGGKQVIFKADTKRDIEDVVAFAEEFGFRMILAGGREASEASTILAEKGIPVILGLSQSLPQEDDDPYDTPFANPGKLREAGVKIAFASGAGGGFGPGGPHASRTTPYEAATAVAYGMSEEDAMKALTLWPAEMLGVGDRLGSLETGKIANIMVTDGSPLEITSNVQHLIIAGREVSTENMHRDLYEKYSSRPESTR